MELALVNVGSFLPYILQLKYSIIRYVKSKIIEDLLSFQKLNHVGSENFVQYGAVETATVVFEKLLTNIKPITILMTSLN